MTYTVTCPDPECKTTFEIDEETFDAAYDANEPFECPGCNVEFEWDYDPTKADGQEITLTEAVEYEEESDEIDDALDETADALDEDEEDDPDEE